MKSLKTASVFRTMLLASIAITTADPIVIVLSAVFLLFWDRRETVLFLLVVLTVLGVDCFRRDLIPVGVVDSMTDSSAVADKFFYKVRIYDIEDLEEGDLLFFDHSYRRMNNDVQVRKNILFEGEGYRKVLSFPLRKMIRKRIDREDTELSSSLKKLLYNEYSPDLRFELGYGLSAYYLGKRLGRRSRLLCLGFVFLFSCLFVFDIRYYLILIDCLMNRKWDKPIRLSLRYFLIALINPSLFHNPSFLLPFLFELFPLFESSIGFRTYFTLISSLLFCENGLIESLFFHMLKDLRISAFLFSFIYLVFPFSLPVYRFLLKGISFVYSHDLSIRGRISLPGVLLFFALIRKFRVRNDLLQMCILSIIILLPIHFPFTHVSFIDVGQGDAILISQPLSFSFTLIDTGSPYNYGKLKKALFAEGIYEIDHLIITHDDADHNGNIEALNQDFRINDLVKEGKDIREHGLYFRYLDPGEFDNDNDNSLVYFLDIAGTSFLFTGDISKIAERSLIRRYGPLHADILKASHHGSKSGNSDFFVSELLPKIAIISTSGQYGHPHQEVLETFRNYKVEYFSTDQCGTISICIGKLFSFISCAKNRFVIMR